MTISNILARKGGRVITIRPEQSVRQALGLLAQHNIGALVVVSETGAAVGIVSERDIVREAVRHERVFERTVESLMTRDVVVGLPADDVASTVMPSGVPEIAGGVVSFTVTWTVPVPEAP